MPPSEEAERAVVLVVEDDPLLRMLAAGMIEDAGFAVAEARDAAQAMAALASRTDIALVFTDVNLPDGVDGMALVAEIRARWPALGIVVTSGRPLPADARLPPDSEFFLKPYRQARVIEAIQRLAD